MRTFSTRSSLKVFLFFISLSIVGFAARASNYYWIGGSGNWSDLSHWATTSGGTTLYTQIPTAVDDVFFDANSFTAAGQTVNFDPLTLLVRSISWAGVTNNPTMAGSSSNLLKLYGSLTFSAGMTMSFAGQINFESTTTGRTITTAGKSFTSTINFIGAGGGWTLQDNLTANGISIGNGTVNTNGKTINCGSFNGAGGSLNMSGSVFNVSGGWSCTMLSPNLTTTGSVINCSAPGASFNSNAVIFNDVNFTSALPGSVGALNGGCSYHDVTFASNALITGSNSFHDVSIAGNASLAASNSYNNLSFSAGHTYTLSTGTVQTVNGVFAANGNCGALVEIHSADPGNTATISHPAGAVNISYAVLKDIHAAGGGTFTAANSTDLGNNTGWTITGAASQNLYWIGNSGNWDNGSHWSFTSGGAASGCSPRPIDNVFFDANSFSTSGQTVTINPLTAYCRDMNWTGVTNSPTMGGSAPSLLKIYGSLTFTAGMTQGYTGPVNFEATATGKTITMAGKSFNEKVDFNGIGGDWTLQDVFTTTNLLTLSHGIINTNNKTVFALQFYSPVPSPPMARGINMGSSVFNLSGGSAWLAEATGMTLNCGTSLVNCLSAGATFKGGTLTYYDVNFTSASNGAAGNIYDNCTFHDVAFSSNGIIWSSNTFHNVSFAGDGLFKGYNIYNNLSFSPSHTYTLTDGKNQTINGVFSATGTCGALIEIRSETPGVQTGFIHPPGAVNISYTILKDLSATGGAVFTATNSIDQGNNTGWTINAAAGKNLYWIGNSGNWDNGNHWSLTSGGAPSGCAPTPLDNVFFDANSFSLSGQTVLINIPTAYCRDMTWTGAANNPTLAGSFLNNIKIYGSITLVSGMSWTFAGPISFEATSAGKTVTMAGKSFLSNVDFNGINGTWTLQDAFNSTARVSLNHGVWTTNNKTVNVAEFYSTLPPLPIARTLNMGSSVFNISGGFSCWYVIGNGLTINGGTSVINLTAPNSSPGFTGGDATYYDLNFTGTGAVSSGTISGSNHFHDVVFASDATIIFTNTFHNVSVAGDGVIQSSNTYNDLLFTAGHDYKLGSGSTQTIADHFKVQGSCTSYIVLEASAVLNPAYIVKSSGTVLGYNIHMKDIQASGGATFIAYNSVDLGGNSGWNFTSLPPLLNPTPIQGPTQVCPNATGVVYQIPPVTGAISYQWTVPPGVTITSGQGDNLIVVTFGSSVSGTITVQSFNGCNYGTLSSGITLTAGGGISPTISLAASPGGPVCPGSNIVFTATAGGTSGGTNISYDFKVNGISKQTGASNTFNSTSLANGDIVTVVLSLNGGLCSSTITVTSNPVTVTVKPAPAPGSADITICSNELPYQWNGHTYTVAGDYPVTLNGTNGCDSVVTLHLSVYITENSNCICLPIIPNAFTPNGDGKNDHWVITHGNCIYRMEVSVYNRYGSIIYHNDDYKDEWDGTYRSKTCPDGTYYYVLKTLFRGINYQVFKGNVTVLR